MGRPVGIGIMMNFAEWLAAKGIAPAALAPAAFADAMAAYFAEAA